MSVEIKTEYKHFIESRALKGLSSGLIKKELDQIYKKKHNNVPSLRTVAQHSACFLAASQRNSTLPIIDEKYRTFIENRVNNGKCVGKIINDLFRKYGKNSVSERTIYSWAAYFKSRKDGLHAKSSNSDSVEQNLTIVQNDTKKQEFVKSRVLIGLSVPQIKRDFDLEYGSHPPSLSTVEAWTSRFRAASSGNVNANDSNLRESESKTDMTYSNVQPQIQNETSHDECLLSAVTRVSESFLIENSNNEQNIHHSDNDLQQESVNVCEVENNAKKSHWYKFKWTNQDAIDRRESLISSYISFIKYLKVNIFY